MMSTIYIAERAQQETDKSAGRSAETVKLNNIISCAHDFMNAASGWNDNLPASSLINLPALKLMGTSLRNIAADAVALGADTVVVPIANGSTKAEAVQRRFDALTGGKSTVSLRFTQGR